MDKITNQKDLRDTFWIQNPQFERRPGVSQNHYGATIRTSWVEFVDYMQKSGQISSALADRATL